MAQTDNAITRRADQMQEMWRDFLENPTARTCYWVVEPDEERMMDAFYIANLGDSPKTPDMFLRLEAPFKDISTYGSMLSETLAYLMDLERPSFEAYEIPLKWQSEHQEDPSNRALGFLRNFFKLASELHLGEGVVVAYLDPQIIQRKDEWERWCFDATRLNLPDKIRLMFVETEGKQTLQKLANQYPQRIHVIKPNLDMNGAVRELIHEIGDQTDKGTHFQKAFFELGQCIAQKDMAGMKVHAEKAIGISRNMGYPHLEIAVLCATANGFLTNQQPKVAITVYDEAFRVAQAARDKPLIPEFPDLKMDDSNGNIFDQLSVQALFSKGTALITQRPPQYQAAFEVYQQADGILQDMISKKQDFAKEKVDFETGGALLMHRVEALRLSGFCLEGLKQGKKALDIYGIAVGLAEKWTPEIRKASTLPFIGQAMMKLYHEFAMKQAFHGIVQKMNGLLGEDWEKKLPKK